MLSSHHEFSSKFNPKFRVTVLATFGLNSLCALPPSGLSAKRSREISAVGSQFFGNTGSLLLHSSRASFS